MAKIERWKSNKDVDPDYPYYSRKAEDGTIYYSIPLEAPNDIPVDRDAPDEDKPKYSYLSLFGGINVRVYFTETPDKSLAYRIRAMINTAHSQDRRYAERFTVVPDVLGDGANDGNHKISRNSCEEPDDAEELAGEEQETSEHDHGKKNGYQQHGWPTVEKQALDRIEIQAIRDLVKSTNPRCWEVFYQVKLYGEDAKAVADRMGISVPRIYQLLNRVTEIAKSYRKQNR